MYIPTYVAAGTAFILYTKRFSNRILYTVRVREIYYFYKRVK